MRNHSRSAVKSPCPEPCKYSLSQAQLQEVTREDDEVYDQLRHAEEQLASAEVNPEPWLQTPDPMNPTFYTLS